uniref:ATP-dependent DNA ligase family profile domain-containing protein n=1 Tax=viral metagenome TaxID=1070528 RepID=A0A6C0JAP2_9ZZZZ
MITYDKLHKLKKDELFRLIANVETEYNKKLNIPKITKKEDIIIKLLNFFEQDTGDYNLTELKENISVTLAKEFSEKYFNRSNNWWMSEKLDGYRAYLKDGNFFTRNNKIMTSVSEFAKNISKYTNEILDGELWFGVDSFQMCGALRTKEKIPKEKLDTLKYVVFDYIPSDSESDEPYYKRYTNLKNIIAKIKLPNVVLIIQTPVKNIDEIKKESDKIVKRGGEGLMLKDSNSNYIHGRTDKLLKYKLFKDTEVTIVGYNIAKKGKHTGKLGAFVTLEGKLKNPKKVIYNDLTINQQKQYIRVGGGLTDELRENYKNTHPIGTIITVKFFEYTPDQKPRFPSYLRKYV